MQIKQEDNGNKGRFYIVLDGSVAAEMTYVWAGNTRFIIDHTEVSPVLKGKGAGKELVAFAVDYARKNQVKITPLCPFAQSVFDKTPEYADVLM